MPIKFLFLVTTVFAMSFAPRAVRSDDERLEGIERLAAADPKPFVLVEARGEGSVTRGQGVVITAQGHVLSAGHAHRHPGPPRTSNFHPSNRP
jgi:hypothetical protein